MAIKAANVLSGITEIGHVNTPYGTPVDVKWGATEEDGAELRINGQTVDVRSGQSRVLEDQFLSAIDMELVMRLQYTDLLNVARALGLDDTAVTGDLNAGTPTAEVLEALQTAIGKTERYLYIITPGPKSTRRIELKRCKVSPNISMAFASNDYQKLEMTWAVLRPKQTGHEDKPIKVTDAV